MCSAQFKSANMRSASWRNWANLQIDISNRCNQERLNQKIYFQKMQIVFPQIIAKYICMNYNFFLQICLKEMETSATERMKGQIRKYIRKNLHKLPKVFVQTAKCICTNCKMYLYKLQNVFLQIEKKMQTLWKKLYFQPRETEW